MTQDARIGKPEVLKARVSEALHREFNDACFALGVAPAAQIRSLVEGFVATRRDLAEEDVKVLIERPDGYMDGAWRVRVTLREREAMEFRGVPVAFGLPRLPSRRVSPDQGFAVAMSGWDGVGAGLDGVFVDGVWEGHVYSDGIAEGRNPTAIGAVADALRAEIGRRIEVFRAL